jgi:GMP synthase (glutamine-hydrolysing)
MSVDERKYLPNKETLRVHCFQHVDFEDLGCIRMWCDDKGYPVTYTRFFHDPAIPHTEAYDLLIVMGGPMGVNEESNYPWLVYEKLAIKEAIACRKIVLGICLGSQLIAQALGARVFKNAEKEIGWYDLYLTEHSKESGLFGKTPAPAFTVFHWHGDTFEMPEEAIHLAYSEACINQAFLYKGHVLGLQFHIEVTEDNVKTMLKNGKHELGEGRYIQHAREILNQKQFTGSNNRIMFHLLDTLIQNSLVNHQLRE